MARGHSSFRSHSQLMMISNIFQAKIVVVIALHSAALRLQAHAPHPLASFDKRITRTMVLFSNINHIHKLARRTSPEISLPVHSRTNLQKTMNFQEFSRIFCSLMDNERRENLNWYVAQEASATFSREELALYVLLWLQMRPVKLGRHR